MCHHEHATNFITITCTPKPWPFAFSYGPERLPNCITGLQILKNNFLLAASQNKAIKSVQGFSCTCVTIVTLKNSQKLSHMYLQFERWRRWRTPHRRGWSWRRFNGLGRNVSAAPVTSRSVATFHYKLITVAFKGLQAHARSTFKQWYWRNDATLWLIGSRTANRGTAAMSSFLTRHMQTHIECMEVVPGHTYTRDIQQVRHFTVKVDWYFAKY